MKKNVIMIPARIASSRFPRKMLADVAGAPMIIRVLEQAQKVTNAEVFVATDDREIFNVVEEHSKNIAIMTSLQHESGTDRVFEALEKIDPEGEFKNIINLQGDLPVINPKYIENLIGILQNNNEADIVTLAAPFSELSKAQDENIVKIALARNGKALYFSRSAIPHGSEEFFYHVGIYGFKRNALKQFISYPQSDLEKCERLEQLRALENGMNVFVGKIDEEPASIDTKEDLAKLLLNL